MRRPLPVGFINDNEAVGEQRRDGAKENREQREQE